MEEGNIKTDYQLIELGIRYQHLNINKRVFIKTEQEKMKLKAFKKTHHARLRAAGFDPKKRMNLSESQHLKFSC